MREGFLPSSSVPLQSIGLPSTRTLDPSKFPSETFELYSVPAYSKRVPDLLVGSEIKSTKQLVQPDDILLCKIVPHLNRVWRVRASGSHRQIASGEWIVVRPSENVPDYLRYALLEPGFREEFMRTVSGVGGSLMRARPKAVAQITVRIPSIVEQRQIVSKLDVLFAKSHAAREELGRIPRLVERYKQSVLSEVFNVEATRAWNQQTLEKVIEEGLIGLVRSKNEQNHNEGTPYIRMNHYDLEGKWNKENLSYVRTSSIELKRYELQPYDVLFNTRNSTELVGKVAIWPANQPNHVYNNNLLRIRFKPEVLPTFAALYMKSPIFLAYLASVKSATTSVAAIYQRSLYAAPFPLPNFLTQQKIATAITSKLESINSLASEAASGSLLLDRLDQATLAKAFRGELICNGDAPTVA